MLNLLTKLENLKYIIEYYLQLVNHLDYPLHRKKSKEII